MKKKKKNEKLQLNLQETSTIIQIIFFCRENYFGKNQKLKTIYFLFLEQQNLKSSEKNKFFQL